jgi:hypothetical protein
MAHEESGQRHTNEVGDLLNDMQFNRQMYRYVFNDLAKVSDWICKYLHNKVENKFPPMGAGG